MRIRNPARPHTALMWPHYLDAWRRPPKSRPPGAHLAIAQGQG